MLEQLKKNMFIGIGLMAMTTERVKEFGKKLAEDSKLSEAEGEKLVNELLKQKDEMKKHLEDSFSKIVDDKLKSPRLPCNANYEKLEKEIAGIKETLARIESKLNS